MTLTDIAKTGTILLVAGTLSLSGCSYFSENPTTCPGPVQGEVVECSTGKNYSTKPRPGPNPIHGTGRGTIYDKD